MLTHETARNYSYSSLFLKEPSPLAELDSWVEEYLQSQQRFTFAEHEVLKLLWQEGEDIRLREDSRFQEVTFPEPLAETQWRLAMHTVANQHLYNLLLDELWDGHDLFHCLEKFDKDTNNSAFHIFALSDERLLLTQTENYQYHLTLRETTTAVELTIGQKSLLDQLLSQLLDHLPQEETKPWTTSSLLEELRRLAHPLKALQEVLPTALENWLLHKEEWVRVGVDSWLPKSKLPTTTTRHRYAVPPVFTSADNLVVSTAMPDLMSEKDLAWDSSQMVEEPESLNKGVRWRVILRTFHINEGSLSVPKQARSFYPHARRLSNTIVIPGLWFTDASDITLWLDRTKHQLFGPDLQDQLAFLEAGTILEITWTTFGIRFYTVGLDPKVAEEETRLVDLSCLSQLRSSTLESYRASLRAIMSEQNKTLSFQEVYEALCERQQHKPNRVTIRTILSSSPEFVFVKAEGKWSLKPGIASDIGAKFLRRSIMVACQSEVDSSMTQQELLSPSLSQMIAKNRQQMASLRSLYLSDRKPDVS